MLETLLKKLEQYCHFLRAPSDPQTVEGSLGVLGQIAHVASLIADSWSVMPTSPPDLEDKNLLRNIVQKAADVLSFINSSNTTQSANAIFQTGGINLMAHIVCLVRNCGDAALETTEIMREFTTSLCHYYHNLQIREIQNQYLQDLIGWLLQSEFIACFIITKPTSKLLNSAPSLNSQLCLLIAGARF